MRMLLILALLAPCALTAQTSNYGNSAYSVEAHRKLNSAVEKKATRPGGRKNEMKVVPARFALWEKMEDLRKRVGQPGQYYVPVIEKLISPAEFEQYRDSYKKVYDVFYRDTPVGLVRVLVAYGKDDSRSHLDPDTRVTHVYFIFDKNVELRNALAAIAEVRELCAGGCRLNGFAASVIAQPSSPNEAQILLASKMRRQWNEEMPDATPGVQVFYRDSPYTVDFEHSPVERIDLTLVSNASQEKYSIVVRKQEPTMLNVWRPGASH
jgi:hypothetical protein